jgi:Adenylate and Guanylate cyclase catalytic domain
LDVLFAVADKAVNKRPPVPASCPPKAQTLMMECLVGDPRRRPTFEELDLQLKRLDIATMEPIRSKEDSNKEEQALLLYDLFPGHVADALKEGRKVEPQSRDHCTIFSSRIYNFEEMSSTLGPLKVSDMLQRLYGRFDALCTVYDVYKVETVSDSYMVRFFVPGRTLLPNHKLLMRRDSYFVQFRLSLVSSKINRITRSELRISQSPPLRLQMRRYST